MLLPDRSQLQNDIAQLPASVRVLLPLDRKQPWAHRVTAESCPELHGIFCHSLESLQLGGRRDPQLFMFESNAMEARYCMVLGKPTVVMSIAMVKALDLPNLQYLANHELGHKKYSRRKAMLIGSSFLGYAGAMAAIALDSSRRKRNHEGRSSLLDTATTYAEMGLSTVLMLLLVQEMVRRDEFTADRHALDVMKDPSIIRDTFNRLRDAMHQQHTAPQEQAPPDESIPVVRASTFKSIMIHILDRMVNRRYPTVEDRVEAGIEYAAKKGYTRE